MDEKEIYLKENEAKGKKSQAKRGLSQAITALEAIYDKENEG